MYKGKTFLAIIPARGGSKRIPGKNIKPLNGKPLIQWTVEAAKGSAFLDRACVTTDDDEISRVAAFCGADMPVKRPSHLADDASPTIDSVIHLMDWLKENEKRTYDYVVLLQPTSPYRQGRHIDSAIRALVDGNGIDSLASFRKAPAKSSWFVARDRKGFVKKIFDDRQEGRSLSSNPEDLWEYNGAIYICKWNSVKKNRSFETGRTLLFEMDEYSSIDLDTEQEWAYAEYLLKRGFVKC